jgi:ATP-dependent RNA helicase RhlE
MFKEKLYKKLVTNLVEHQFDTPTPLQAQCLSKINSGADVIVTGPEGSGKSTMIALMAVHKLQWPMVDAPRALILTGDQIQGQKMEEQLKIFTRDTGLRVRSAYEEGNMDHQIVDIYEGTDILIGTTKRIIDLYFMRSLNLNKIKLFAVDEPEAIIKHAWHGQIDRLSLSLPKCQRLVFTRELDPRIEKLISKFMVAPQLVEIP